MRKSNKDICLELHNLLGFFYRNNFNSVMFSHFLFPFCAQLHMLGEGSRGATLEITLAKILYTSSKSWLQLILLKYCSDGISREKS